MGLHSGQFTLEFMIILLASLVFLLTPLYIISANPTAPPIHEFERSIFGDLLR